MSGIETRDDNERRILAMPHLSEEMKKDIIEASRKRRAQFEEGQVEFRTEMGAKLQTRAEETSRHNAELRQKAEKIIDDTVQRAGRDITAALEKVEAVKRKK